VSAYELPTIDQEVCRGCGACCLRQPWPPFLDEHELAAIPRRLREELKRASRDRTGLPCFWLDLLTHECRHYEHRPVACREFQPGSENCLEDRAACGL